LDIAKLYNSDKPLVSIVIINSREDVHPQWVKQSIESAYNQNIPVEVIIVGNIGRVNTIGHCWNEGVRASNCDFVFFLGDDDSIAFSHCEMLYRWFNSKQIKDTRVQNISSYMTAFDEISGRKSALARQNTGMWRKEYLLKYPFNEKIQKGIDREYIEETVKRGDNAGKPRYNCHFTITDDRQHGRKIFMDFFECNSVIAFWYQRIFW